MKKEQSINEIISAYLEPCEKWPTKSHEEFMDNFFRKGKFHKDVPDIIVKDYEIVERLIFYSYYYYSLYDEAYAKLTQIFEAALNLRLKELNIPKNPNTKFESLDERIKKLEDYTTQNTIDKWQRTRKIRNLFAHRKSGTYMGVALNLAFWSTINIINLIFLEKTFLEENELKLESLKKDTNNIFSGPIILNINGKKHLYSSIEPVAISLNKKRNTSLWALKSSHTYKRINKNSLESNDPICIELHNVKISSEMIKGVIYSMGNKVIISKYDQKLFKQEYPINLPEIDLFIFKTGDEVTIRGIISKYNYNNWSF